MLEAGEYAVSIRSDSHTVIDERTFTLSADKDYSGSGRSSDQAAPVNHFDYMEGSHPTLSRKDGFANYDAATAAPGEDEFELSKDRQNAIQEISVVKYDPADYDNPDDVMPTTGAKGSLTLADLAGKGYDDANWEKLLNQLSIEDMTTLINTGGWQTAAIESVGKVAPPTVTAPPACPTMSPTLTAPSSPLKCSWPRPGAKRWRRRSAIPWARSSPTPTTTAGTAPP